MSRNLEHISYHKKFLNLKLIVAGVILNDDNEDTSNSTRQNVISLMDNFIEQLLRARKTLALAFTLSISSILLTPLAIGISIFLLLHPSFFVILEKEDGFGIFLSILLIGIIIVSSTWLVTGIKQYRSIRSWNKKYDTFLKKREEIDRNILSEYDDLDQD
jgi:hypothetical protein